VQTARPDWDKIAKLLKPVNTAATEEAALERFAEFAGTQRTTGRQTSDPKIPERHPCTSC
jgi:hypothetical protein